MGDAVNRQILLVEKPTGKLGPEHFKMSEGAIPEPKDGEALLRTRYISLDAANRAWMHGATYRAAVEANTVMAGGAIAEVVSSKAPSLKPGDIVFGDTGWQDYAAVPAKHLSRMPKLEPMTHLRSMVSSSDILRAPERPTAIATLNRQRHLTPSCGGHTPTAERTVGPAIVSSESLTPRPGSKYPPAKPGALGLGPLKAARWGR